MNTNKIIGYCEMLEKVERRLEDRSFIFGNLPAFLTLAEWDAQRVEIDKQILKRIENRIKTLVNEV